jgi:hypothetical protein
MAVKLTLLPMLASAAVAAQPASEDEPPLQPPGATAPLLPPPGWTPAIEECLADPDECPADPDECQTDPDDPPCPPVDEEPPVTDDGTYTYGVFGGHVRRHHHHRHGVFRGGFGHYFWAAGS